MKYAKALAIAVLAGATLVGTGCSVMRGQETVGAYVDDASITSSANLSKDQTFSATFASAGTFTYKCSIHPSMTGTITVS